ncbi:MAG TPA: Hsp20/alpha crystallin family protein, partial [Burkholderiaceae bacterium]
TDGAPGGIRSVAYGSFPAVNVGRTATSVEVYAFAPGLDASQVDVTIDRGILRLSGERRTQLPEDGADAQVYARERGEGRFSRAVSLPDDVDTSKVRATYRDGVLQVSIALLEAAQPQRIAVQ